MCDYGMGNLRSVERALVVGGAQVVVSGDPRDLDDAAGIVLPGVGAFGAAAESLAQDGLDDAVRRAAADGRPVLGVCLGFQLLFAASQEAPGTPGLGLLDGQVRRLRPAVAKVPHIGWNTLQLCRPSRLLEGVVDGAWMYFVHSYAVECRADDVVAVAHHGDPMVAAVERHNLMATQFHPEKSGADGLAVYSRFIRQCARGAEIGLATPP